MDALLTPDDIERMAIERGMLMAEVCAKAGVAQTTFWRWKNSKTEPTLAVYRRIVEAVSAPGTEPPEAA